MTRAVEILGERWTLLLVRELFYGPKRFSDLKASLGGVSTSVLASRLARLEERGIILRGELPAPAASSVYELADSGRALQPVLMELARWGLRFMDPPGPDDRMEPAWLRLGMDVFARRGPTPACTLRLSIGSDGQTVCVFVRGGGDQVVVSDQPLPCDASISAAAMPMLMMSLGALPVAASDMVSIEGDAAAAARLPELFDFTPTPAPAPQAGASTTAPVSQTGAGSRLG